MNYGTVAELQTSFSLGNFSVSSFFKKHLAEKIICLTGTVILSQAAWAYWTVVKF